MDTPYPMPASPWYNKKNGLVEGAVTDDKLLGGDDSPTAYFPLYYKGAAAGSVTWQDIFVLDVAAQTDETANGANLRYVREANVVWNVNGSGTIKQNPITGALEWNPIVGTTGITIDNRPPVWRVVNNNLSWPFIVDTSGPRGLGGITPLFVSNK